MIVTTTLAAGDLITGTVTFWNDFRVPGAIGLLIVGVLTAIFAYHKGFGAAAGKLIGAIALAAITLGAAGLVNSAQQTLDNHTGGITRGQYGQ